MQISPLESYVRRSDTLPARISNMLSPHRGLDYLNSWQKEYLDKAMAVPLIIASSVITPFLSLMIKVIDKQTPYITQSRVSGALGEIQINKFQTLVKDAHLIDRDKPIASLNDPRITPMGRWIRGLELDELPQIPQVFKGELALLGPRTLLKKDIELVAKSSPELGEIWKEKFTKKLPHAAIITSHSMDDPLRKSEHGRNIPYDLDYMDNATLLLDLYFYFGKLPPFIASTLFKGISENLRIIANNKPAIN